MNDQYPYGRVNMLMNDRYQQEQVNTPENDQLPEDSPESPAVTADAVQETETPSLEGKTEPWKAVIPDAPVVPYVPDAPIVSYVPVAPAVVPAAPAAQPAPDMLLSSEETGHFRTRWTEVQAKFVDEPGSSVREADALVAELMTQISQMLTNERQKLESQWNQGDVSTENLRQVLKSYRSFFNRLLK